MSVELDTTPTPNEPDRPESPQSSAPARHRWWHSGTFWWVTAMIGSFVVGMGVNLVPVSYTHLDVYKRQPY